MASISKHVFCLACCLEVMEWPEVAASHCHLFAGGQWRRTTAGSHTNGCMVEYSVPPLAFFLSLSTLYFSSTNI